MKNSCDEISIVEFLSFAIQIPSDDYKILVSSDCIDTMIQNALDRYHIFGRTKSKGSWFSCRGKEKEVLKVEKYAEKPRAEPIIHSLNYLSASHLSRDILGRLREAKICLNVNDQDLDDKTPIMVAVE